MVFNAMVTNNDDHPRNHAMLRTTGGWRLSPAYDIVPAPLISLERRELALEAGRYGRVASVYNLLSDCGSFGLNVEEAQRVINTMVEVVKGWRDLFRKHSVEERSIVRIPVKLDSDSTPSWTRIPEQAGQSERSDAGFSGFTLLMS
jgi:serine/threonine-protein kinase HipA